MPKQYPPETLRHSFAHVIAAAVQKLYPQAQFGVGPVIENGFYYDIKLPKTITESDLAAIAKETTRLISANIVFTKKEMAIASAITLFKKKKQPFKVALLNDLKKKGTTRLSSEEKEMLGAKKVSKVSIYETGDFVDLCRGPHVASTGDLDPAAFKLTKISGAYWRGSEKNPQLTRIYGAAFATNKELDDYVRLQSEIAKRDHRVLGTALDLFSQHPIAPGAIFWHPKGMILWRVLEKFIREKLDESYGEVSTPVMVKQEVFERSGHWEHYRDNMLSLEIEKETYVLKPMNCPESTYIYNSQLRSWRDLPLRLSEVTDKLHRNEPSGTLGGLFRVRQLSQDDAHIYCREDQIETEIKKLVDLTQEIYRVFDLEPSFRLGTKPDEAMGEPALWKKAEAALMNIMNNLKKGFELKPKDGAFYGPKIDMHVKDSLGRDWQLATIQLDFQMPRRFGLSYIDEKGEKAIPVIIHRAILGTFERFIGILIEHYAGAFPMWLAPVQVALLPINDKNREYVAGVAAELKERGIRVETDERNESIGKKIRDAELKKIPYLLVIGDREATAKTVAVRERGKGDLGAKNLDAFIKRVL
ncbi:MAG: Threonine-tRNA ligase [Parcubacteria group bacterium GW2011_GWA1_51_12]|nr:MAG: Threonine-tRNA ligase [Parcubacteria group bacterium GW2011_GWA1_51_12]